nr:MAG TPA: hypothetical protein [Caudoviricetes sp.]
MCSFCALWLCRGALFAAFLQNLRARFRILSRKGVPP